MEIILKRNVEGLGVPGDVLKVADGYARNYLLPMQLAVHATERNRKQVAHAKRLIDHQVSKDREIAREIAGRIAGVTCNLRRRAGENDRLFGSVTTTDIAEALRAEGFELERRVFDMAEPIRELGVFMVPVKLHADVVVELRVVVERESEE